MNARNAENFMRSATAPRISAGVMIANIAWNMMKMYSGIWRGGLAKFAVIESIVTPFRNTLSRFPTNDPPPFENARL